MIDRRSFRSVSLGLLVSLLAPMSAPLAGCSAPATEQAGESSSAVASGSITMEMNTDEFTLFRASVARPDGQTGNAVAYLQNYGDGFKVAYQSNLSAGEDEAVIARWEAESTTPPVGLQRLAEIVDAILRIFEAYQSAQQALEAVLSEIAAVDAELALIAANSGTSFTTYETYPVDGIAAPGGTLFAFAADDRQKGSEEEKKKQEEQRQKELEKKKLELDLKKLELETKLKELEVEAKEKTKELEAEKERIRLQNEKLKGELEKMRLMLEKEFLESKLGKLITKYGAKAGVVVSSGIATAIVWVVKLFTAK